LIEEWQDEPPPHVSQVAVRTSPAPFLASWVPVEDIWMSAGREDKTGQGERGPISTSESKV